MLWSRSTRMTSSTKIKSNTPKHKKWYWSMSTIRFWSTWHSPSKLLTSFTSSCSSWVHIWLYRGWRTVSALVERKEIPLKTGQVLCDADISCLGASSLQGFHLSRPKALECTYGHQWLCESHRFWTGQNCKRWWNRKNFLWNPLVSCTLNSIRWRLWQDSWLVVFRYFNLRNDARTPSIL